MEGSDLNYYFNWIKSQLSSQVCLFLTGNIWYFRFSSAGEKLQISLSVKCFLFFCFCLQYPINFPAPPQQPLNKQAPNWDDSIFCALQQLYNLNERVSAFFFLFFAVVYLSLEPTWYRSRNRLRSRNYFPQWSKYESSVPPRLDAKDPGPVLIGVSQLSLKFHIFSFLFFFPFCIGRFFIF